MPESTLFWIVLVVVILSIPVIGLVMDRRINRRRPKPLLPSPNPARQAALLDLKPGGQFMFRGNDHTVTGRMVIPHTARRTHYRLVTNSPNLPWLDVYALGREISHLRVAYNVQNTGKTPASNDVQLNGVAYIKTEQGANAYRFEPEGTVPGGALGGIATQGELRYTHFVAHDEPHELRYEQFDDGPGWLVITTSEIKLEDLLVLS